MNLTEYLFARLRELGVDHTFGIPGDFILPVYAVQESPSGCLRSSAPTSPGSVSPADAYARLTGPRRRPGDLRAGAEHWSTRWPVPTPSSLPC